MASKPRPPPIFNPRVKGVAKRKPTTADAKSLAASVRNQDEKDQTPNKSILQLHLAPPAGRGSRANPET